MVINKSLFSYIMIPLASLAFVLSLYHQASGSSFGSYDKDLIQSLAIGPIINSESSSYKLIPNSSVSSIFDPDGHRHENYIANDSDGIIWAMDIESFHLSIRSKSIEYLDHRVFPNYQLALNQERDSIAIVTGEIIASLLEGFDADVIASNYDLELKAYYDHSNTAFFTIKDSSELLEKLNLLKQDIGIDVAYIDVIDSINIPY